VLETTPKKFPIFFSFLSAHTHERPPLKHYGGEHTKKKGRQRHKEYGNLRLAYLLLKAYSLSSIFLWHARAVQEKDEADDKKKIDDRSEL
jgi:hypothetical protein